jgi:hypothetical protein
VVVTIQLDEDGDPKGFPYEPSERPEYGTLVGVLSGLIGRFPPPTRWFDRGHIPIRAVHFECKSSRGTKCGS